MVSKVLHEAISLYADEIGVEAVLLQNCEAATKHKELSVESNTSLLLSHCKENINLAFKALIYAGVEPDDAITTMLKDISNGYHTNLEQGATYDEVIISPQFKQPIGSSSLSGLIDEEDSFYYEA